MTFYEASFGDPGKRGRGAVARQRAEKTVVRTAVSLGARSPADRAQALRRDDIDFQRDRVDDESVGIMNGVRRGGGHRRPWRGARRTGDLDIPPPTRTRTFPYSGAVGTAPDSGATRVDPVAFCRARRIPCYDVASLDSPDGHAPVASLRPDLAVHAGAGILRVPLLALLRLGTLNAHMGVLPYYRGMNVAEWARFNGDPVGCAVHLVDAGIDMGPIACVRIVDTQTAPSIGDLRRLVDDAQIALLGDVIRCTMRSGSLPPVRSQGEEEGLQFFRMHPAVAAVLNG